jgi:hypothetical protein
MLRCHWPRLFTVYKTWHNSNVICSVVCPSNCLQCSQSNGVVTCNSGMCMQGYARAVDGSCQSECVSRLYLTCISGCSLPNVTMKRYDRFLCNAIYFVFEAEHNLAILTLSRRRFFLMIPLHVQRGKIHPENFELYPWKR